METIGFWGQVDLNEVERQERAGVRFLKDNGKVSSVGLNFLKEKLKNFNVQSDYEYSYEDGMVEFLVDYEPGIDLAAVKKAIESLEGMVKFIRFF